jgi:hypothetical protein
MKNCPQARKEKDVKEMMATLLIHHNLLGKEWENFHKDVQELVEKYYPHYEKGMKLWMDKGEINKKI